MGGVHGYSRAQIALHWIVAVLVALQCLLHEPISRAWEASQAGEVVTFQPLIVLHVGSGLVILLLVLWRLGLLAWRGVPPPPDREPRFYKLAAKLVHAALYLLLVAMPLTGLLAWFGGVAPAAAAHEVLQMVLLALIVVHVLAVLVHLFVLRMPVLRRMLHPTQDSRLA
jgi:cytochrome b561